MNPKINSKMAETAIIKPFIHFDKGQCPKCGNNCVVLEDEISSTILADNGLPVTYDVEHYKAIAYCPTCNNRFQVIKRGMEFEVVTNAPLKEKLDKIFGRTYEEDVSKEVDNPFAKVKMEGLLESDSIIPPPLRYDIPITKKG